MRPLAVVALAALVGGCSVFWSTSDFSGGEDRGADAGADAPTDGAPASLVPVTDAGGGDADVADGPCATLQPPPGYCADFENGPVEANGTLEVLAGPPPTIDTKERATGTSSLLVALPASAEEADSRVVKVLSSAGGVSSFELSVSVRLDAAMGNQGAYTELVALNYATATKNYRFVIWQNGITLAVRQLEIGGASSDLATMPASPSVWRRVRLVGGFGSKVQIFVDGVELAERVIPFLPDGPITNVTLKYGCFYSDPTPTAKNVRLDDLVVSLR